MASYAPALNLRHSKTVKRIAWALDKPMTRTIERMIELFVEKIDPDIVCKRCRDKSYCNECIFRTKQLAKRKGEYRDAKLRRIGTNTFG